MDLNEEIPADPSQQQAVTSASNIQSKQSADPRLWPQRLADHGYRIQYDFENKVQVIKAAIEDEEKEIARH